MVGDRPTINEIRRQVADALSAIGVPESHWAFAKSGKGVTVNALIRGERRTLAIGAGVSHVGLRNQLRGLRDWAPKRSERA